MSDPNDFQQTSAEAPAAVPEETTPPEPAPEAATEPTPTAEPTAEPTPEPTTTPLASDTTPWQAIFSPQFNAYYFYNAETQETTWENPLQPTPPPADPAPDSTQSPPDQNPYAALHAAALAAGVDPSLAHLDPSLLSSLPSSSSAPAYPGAPPPTFTAKFNARTGQFTRPDARDPTHLSEHARATRMSEFYFDVKAWEDELAQRGGSLMGNAEASGAQEGEGRKRKRPTKKDLERFKEQKKQKKIAKTAWLRT